VTIRQRIKELERLERMRDSGEFSKVTKKEALGFTRKIDRLEMLIGGVRKMLGVPDLLFAVDVRREETAVHEANLLDIPVVAMVDTNCDPANVDYIIPSNDDAIRAIKLIVGIMADAVLEGQAMRKDIEEEVPEESAAAFDVDAAELSDKDLFGDATLAKLEAQRDEETEEVETEESESEEAAPETEEESAEADEETAPEAVEEEPAEDAAAEAEVEEAAPEADVAESDAADADAAESDAADADAADQEEEKEETED
jgi:small subunit ribosomal protein S2